MHRCARWAGLAVLSAALTWSASSHADRFELGGFFGPRVFSKDAQLGNVVGVEDTLSSGVTIGGRISRPLLRWLAIEAELPIATTSTRMYQTDVFWFEPRAQVRFILIPRGG